MMEPPGLSPPVSSFTPITSISQSLPPSILFDFEINDEFKLSQCQSSYFVDPDSLELVYFCPLAEQVVIYNYSSYFKLKLYLPSVQQTVPFNSHFSMPGHASAAVSSNTRNASHNFKVPRQTMSSLGTQYSTSIEGKPTFHS